MEVTNPLQLVEAAHKAANHPYLNAALQSARDAIAKATGA